MGMQTKTYSIPAPILNLVETLRRLLGDPGFLGRHRVRPEDFTRQRQLSFPVVMLFVLQKTVKSIQSHLQEFLGELAAGAVFETVTSGAWTHARAKLRHTAFIELNDTAMLPMVYGAPRQDQVRRWHGRRLVGVDGSLLRLPNSQELREAFGVVQVSNQKGQTSTAYPEGRFVVLYDLLNRIGVSARLEPSRVGEVDLAIEQLRQAQPGDVTINDRGFTGYVYLAWHHFLGVDHISRCSTGSFPAAQDLFRKNQGNRSVVVRLFAPKQERAALRRLGLPLELKVRFLSVRLPTGQLEVLVTSLLQEEQFPTQEFLTVYHWRWNHETFHLMMKGRLDLENFSGETLEAVRQDFFATLLLCNLESVLTEPASESLQAQSADHQHTKQINRAGAYHAIKHELLALLYSQTPVEEVIAKLQCLFLAEPVSVRPERKPPPRAESTARSYHFQRHVKKVVF